MDGTIVYALLKKKIQSASTGISDIKKEDGYLVFVMGDGSEIKVEDSTKDIIAVDIDDNNYIIVTYEDGTTTTSDKAIPYPSEMTGATETDDGTGGLIPKPLKGDVAYLNSRGEWDDTPRVEIENITTEVNNIKNVVPTMDIPANSVLTSDGWIVATEKEIADEFAQWEV